MATPCASAKRRASGRAFWKMPVPAGCAESIGRRVRETFPRVAPDRSIFAGKKYLPLQLLETGRGCPHHCEFCAITAFHGGRYRRRNVDDIVGELRRMRGRTVFFVDDNITADRAGLRELCEKIIPLSVTWISQASIDVAHDEELPRLLARSGCAGLLIGFESLDPARLEGDAQAHEQSRRLRGGACRDCSGAGIAIYGTFVFGYPGDTTSTFDAAVAFARRAPDVSGGLQPSGAISRNRTACHGDGRRAIAIRSVVAGSGFPFRPDAADHRADGCRSLVGECARARRKFYSWRGIAERFANVRANGRTVRRAFMFWTLNAMLRREVGEKSGIPLGLPDESPET